MSLLIVVALLSAFLTWYVRSVAVKKAILDIPNHRSSHTLPTPRGGGVAIVVSFYAGLLWLFVTGAVEERLFYLLLTAVPIAVTGFIDDIISLSAKVRLLVQVAAACGTLFMLGITGYLFFPALFMIVWFTNLFNFLDGTDGYVASEALFVSIAGFLLFHEGSLLLIAASVLGFLPFNWQRASIFMGDVGSTFLGFITALFILHTSSSLGDLLLWALMTLPFWFDATYTLLRRLLQREQITEAHRKHLFQRAVRAGCSHRCVAAVLWGFNLTFLLLFLWTKSLMLLTVALMILLLFTMLIEKRVAFNG